MTIKRYLPWPVKLGVVMLIIGLSSAFAMWIGDLKRQVVNPEPVEAALAAPPVAVPQEIASEISGATHSEVMILRSAQEKLAEQIKVLERENTRLKEDLAFFESLVPTGTGSQGVAIQRLMAERIAPNQLRYRLLVISSTRKDRGFTGTLQFAVNVVQEGKNTVLIFPQRNSLEAEKFQLDFEHYQRVEGTLVVPEGASVRGIQARVLEKGKIKAQQSANL